MCETQELKTESVKKSINLESNDSSKETVGRTVKEIRKNVNNPLLSARYSPLNCVDY